MQQSLPDVQRTPTTPFLSRGLNITAQEKTTASDKQALVSSGQRLFWFDAIRGISALMVCAGHLRAVMFCDNGDIESRAFWNAPFYFVTGLGHQAVMVFFVLSGFFVGGSVIRSRQMFSWKSYSISRLSRLWTVLIPALLFTAVMDQAIGIAAPNVFKGDGYSATWASGPREGLYSSRVETFLGNAFFLQTITTPVFGTNGPLWSLANEFWYYLLFPLIVSIFQPRLRMRSILFTISSIALAVWLPTAILFDGLIWGLGVLVYCWKDKQILKQAPSQVLALAASGLIFLASLVNSKYALIPFDSDLLVGVCFSLFAWKLLDLKAPQMRPVSVAINWCSDVSYTLYLFHFPVVIAFGAYMARSPQFQPTAANLIIYLIAFALILIFSHFAWFLFERNTPYIRKQMSDLLREKRRETTANKTQNSSK